MTEINSITLAGKSWPVTPIPLGRLKIVLPAFGRVGRDFANGEISERTFDDLVVIFSAAMNMTVEEVGEIVAPLDDVILALEGIAKISGLIQVGDKPGEPLPVVSSTGTNSTAG